eukprot:m.920 g.920  ORF g.920 m.920 type:complete len:162 (+) comp204_c0_seq1:2-487(+)
MFLRIDMWGRNMVRQIATMISLDHPNDRAKGHTALDAAIASAPSEHEVRSVAILVDTVVQQMDTVIRTYQARLKRDTDAASDSSMSASTITTRHEVVVGPHGYDGVEVLDKIDELLACLDRVCTEASRTTQRQRQERGTGSLQDYLPPSDTLLEGHAEAIT